MHLRGFKLNISFGCFHKLCLRILCKSTHEADSDTGVIGPAGIVQEVALKHKGTGVIGHNAFMEFPVVKALKGAGIVAAGVAAGVSVAAKGDSFESTKVLRAAMHGAVKYAVTGHAIDVPKLIQAPVQEMPVGALASKYVTSSNSPSKGLMLFSTVLCCAPGLFYLNVIMTSTMN